MKFNSDFAEFLQIVVRLNPGRVERLEKSIGTLDSFIAADDEFGDNFLGLIPAGSWAHRTIIKPVTSNDEFDVDLLVDLDPIEGWEARDYIENLYSQFRLSGVYRGKVSRKTRCLRVTYAGDFHVDLVPYMERSGDNYITNRTEPPATGSYELSNPEKFNTWMDSKERATKGNFRKSVQLLKYLRDHKSTFTCKSIILTTLAGNAVNEIEAGFDPSRYADTATAFVTILEDLSASLPLSMPAVIDPGESGDNFSDRYATEWDYANFRARIASYAEKARQALDETDDAEKSARIWREIFGDSFKKSSSGQLQTSIAKSNSLLAPAPKEQMIDEAPFGFSICIDPHVRAVVTGRVTGNRVANQIRKNGFRQYDLPSRGNKVAKNASIQFKLVTSASKPYDVYWKVRNSGIEAGDVDCLRGEISEDAGGLLKTETTSYRGSHYVEAYVVKDGTVVAHDRQSVIVTQKA